MPLSKTTNYNTTYKREYRKRMQQAQAQTQAQVLEARVLNLTLQEQSQRLGKFQ